LKAPTAKACATPIAADDLPLDQLDPIRGGEDAGLGHAAVLVDGEAPAGDLDLDCHDR
jgi:hypothetical protein